MSGGYSLGDHFKAIPAIAKRKLVEGSRNGPFSSSVVGVEGLAGLGFSGNRTSIHFTQMGDRVN